MPYEELSQLRNYLASTGGRLYVGAVSGGVALADPQHSVLVLGPPRAGKTTTLAIPNVLAAPGPVIATSTKPDVLGPTLGIRSGLGRCWLLDPTGTVPVPAGVERIRWSPVAAATTWDESLVVARGMVGTARPGRPPGRVGPLDGTGGGAYGSVAARRPPIGRRHGIGAQVGPAPGPRPAGRGSRHPRGGNCLRRARRHRRNRPAELSGIFSSTAGVLAAYRSDAVLDAASAVNFDPRSLTRSCDTVYVCAPARHQDLVAPIVVAFLEQARTGCFSARARGEAGPPLTLVLDEVANIAPLPDLPALVSEGGGQGVLTLACLQDLSQARQRWGPAADGFLSLFGTKVVLPGIGDLATLELVSRLGGEVEVPSRSVSRGPWWSPAGRAPTVTWSSRRQRRLPVESVSQQAAGTALALCGARAPERVRLPPWWGTAPFRAVGRPVPRPVHPTIGR